MDKAEALAVIDQLQAHLDRLNEILDLIGDCGSLSPQAIARSKTLMKAAKEALQDDDRRMSAVSGQAALNPTEDAYLRPAIQGAARHLKVPMNTTPNAKWRSDLYEAISDIKDPLGQLKSFLE